MTGIHGFSINTADNTTADFWTAGADYWVVVSSITVDAVTVSFIAAIFSIENRRTAGELIRTTIATLASQTSFTLTAGSADNDAYNDCVAVVSDIASAIQKCVGVVDDYTGATKTVTLRADPAIFTMAAGDNITILADRSLKPAVPHRTLDVSSTGEADANVTQWLSTAAAAPTTAGVPEVDVTLWQGVAPDALISGLVSAQATQLGTQAKADVLAELATSWATALTEAYAADGAAATPAQLLYMILQTVAEFGISGTTLTVKKLDGATTAMVFTLSDAINPVSRTRAS